MALVAARLQCGIARFSLYLTTGCTLEAPRQRFQSGAAILVVMIRWGADNLTGRLETDIRGSPGQGVRIPGDALAMRHAGTARVTRPWV
jgi:hypothetical protein